MLFFLCSSNQKVINRYVLYVKHALITQLFLYYSIDENDIAPSYDHHIPGLSAASLQIFARLNDCSNWDEVDVTFVQTRNSQSL